MKSYLLTGLLAASALATPHGQHRRRAHPHYPHPAAAVDQVVKRGDVKTHWVTQTVWVTETEYLGGVTTVTVDKDQKDAPKEAKPTPDGELIVEGGAQFHEPAKKEPAPTPAAAPPPPPPAAPVQPPAAPAKKEPAPAPAPAKKEPVPAAPSPPENAERSSSGGDYKTGEMTYYAIGLGACGWNDAGSSAYIVAMNAPTMGAQSNGNPLCGKKVEISYNGKTITGEIRDKCPECAPTDLDVSESAFVALCGSTGPGRVNIQWKMLD